MKWHGFMCVSEKRPLDTAISATIIEYSNGRMSLRDERVIVMDAIESWLQNFRETSHDDAASVCERKIVSCTGDAWIFEGPSERDIRVDFSMGRILHPLGSSN